MEYFQFIAKHYFSVSIFLLLSYIAGQVILSTFKIQERSGQLFFYTTSGIGFGIIIVFCAALFKNLGKLSMLSIALLFLIGYFLRGVRSFFNKDRWVLISQNACMFCRRNGHWILLISVLLGPIFILPLYPPTRWDELTYHLPYAKYYVENHGLAVNPFLRYPLYAHNFDLLYAVSLLFGDDILAHLIHAMAAVLTALGIYHLGTVTAERRTGALASLIFLSSPLVVYLMKSSYIDLGLTLFVFLSFYCICIWEITRKDSWLLLAGFASGIAAGSKYSGLFYLPMFIIWIALSGKKPLYVVKFLVPAILCGAPWYIRNYIISGDPISPFGGNIFGYWMWNKQDLIGQYEDLLKAHGTTRDFISLIKLPWNLLFHPDIYMEGAISPWMVFVFPSILIWRKFSSFSKRLSIFVFVNILIWFYTSQILRYLLPVFPMMSLLAAVVLLYLYDKLMKILPEIISSKKIFGVHGKKIVTMSASFLFIMPLLFNDSRILREVARNPLPVTEQMRNRYLIYETQSFYLTDIANKKPSNNIYQVGFETAYYFAKGKIIGDWFGPARYSILFDLKGDSKKIYATLRDMDIQYFLVNTKKVLPLKFNDDFDDYFNLVAEDSDGKLYELKGQEELKDKIPVPILLDASLDASCKEVKNNLAQIHKGL